MTLTRTSTLAAVPTAVLAGVLLLAGCASTVAGTPTPVGATEPGASSRFAALLTECDVVPPEKIAEAVGGDSIERGFFGAICRWTVGGPSGPVRVTFNWFETGGLDIERRTSEQLGYAVQDITVEGRRAVLSRPPQDPGSCVGSRPVARPGASWAGGCSSSRPDTPIRVTPRSRWQS